MGKFVSFTAILALFAGVSPLSAGRPAPRPSISSGRFYCHPKELNQLRDSLRSVEMYGIYTRDGRVTIEPARYGMETRTEKKKKDGKFKYLRLTGSHIVLLSGLPEYNEPEQELILDGTVELPLNGDHRFIYNGTSYIIRHSARLHYNDYPSDIRIYLINDDTGGEQLISRRDNMQSTRSYLVFAGDIDGDGRLDIITNESPKYHQGHLILYLSSFADDGEMVGRAAEERSWNDPPFELLESKGREKFRWQPA